MNAKRLSMFAALLAGIGLASPFAAMPAAAESAVLQPKEGWYKHLTNFEFMREQATIPPQKGVMIIDSRPAARQYDPGHILGAVNIPDSQFDKQLDKLPADKATQLLFYCGGVDCMLSHNSAAKAEKLGYANIKVYADGMPDWKAKAGAVAVSAAYVKKLMDEKMPYTLIDARPKRIADKGMIATAINISDTEFDKHVDKLPADKAGLIVYYCGGLDCVLSDKSAAKARALGYTNVVTYPPGYPEWEKLHGGGTAAGGGGISGGAVAPTAGAKLMSGKEKGSVTGPSFNEVWKQNPASIMVVDVRDAREFAAGTIKGAVNIPMNELEKRLPTLPKDKPVVFVCGTGARSGEAYDTAKMLAGDVQAWFIDAEIKFNSDGSYSIGD
ncbi:MAG: rhodanese-like domain-containing protein, partial [Rhodocyclales bacterium]|nr:rhodanese-like domain-containing protein [Rhodocyclales bacterium]